MKALAFGIEGIEGMTKKNMRDFERTNIEDTKRAASSFSLRNI